MAIHVEPGFGYTVIERPSNSDRLFPRQIGNLAAEVDPDAMEQRYINGDILPSLPAMQALRAWRDETGGRDNNWTVRFNGYTSTGVIIVPELLAFDGALGCIVGKYRGSSWDEPIRCPGSKSDREGWYKAATLIYRPLDNRGSVRFFVTTNARRV